MPTICIINLACFTCTGTRDTDKHTVIVPKTALALEGFLLIFERRGALETYYAGCWNCLDGCWVCSLLTSIIMTALVIVVILALSTVLVGAECSMTIVLQYPPAPLRGPKAV